MRGEDEEVAHQRALAGRVMGAPVVSVMKAAWEAELQDCIERGAGKSGRARRLRRFLRRVEEGLVL